MENSRQEVELRFYVTKQEAERIKSAAKLCLESLSNWTRKSMVARADDVHAAISKQAAA